MPRLCDVVVDRLQQDIIEGRLTEGDKLQSEHELAARFGVSRTAIREALKILVEQGVVVVRPGRGTFVAQRDQRALQRSLSWLARVQGPGGDNYLVELRQLLEPGVCALAAERITEIELLEMKRALASADAAPTPEEFVEADLQFHRHIAEASGNPLVCALLDSIRNLLRTQRIRYFSSASAERARAHHRIILAALERHQPADARQAMDEHLRQVQTDVRQSDSQRNELVDGASDDGP
jgi:GntR family transcriptional repressor for pyruvate dehydrogenase complex